MRKKILRLISLVGGLAIGFAVIAADENYEVAFYKSGLLNDQGVGIDRDVIAEIQKRTGFPFKLSEKPRARIWHELKSGALAMTVSGIPTPEREQFAWFIPYLTQRNMAIVLKKKAAQYRSLEEFVADRDALVGVVRGFVHGKEFDTALSTLRAQGRVYEATSVDALFRLLSLDHRIDLVFALPVFYQSQLKDLKMFEKVQINDWETQAAPIPHCLVLSRKLVSERDVEAMRNTIDEMKTDGTLKAILARYLSEADVEATLRF